MIIDNRITEYLHSLEISRGELLDTIEKKAIEDGVPIIRSETAALLRSLTAALRPENILEIGTAVGYSGIYGCSERTVFKLAASAVRPDACRSRAYFR